MDQINETIENEIEKIIKESYKNAAMHGDTSFVIVCAALVFFMTPGLGYFYSGMARSKNALSLIFISFLSMAVVMLQVRLKCLNRCTLTYYAFWCFSGPYLDSV